MADPPSTPLPPRGILQVVLVYACFAALWILLSDQAVEWLIEDGENRILASTLKGWLFVLVTSLLLYGMLRRLTGAPGPLLLPRPGSGQPGLPFLIVSLIILGVAATGIYHAYRHHYERETARLQAIAELKTHQISDWIEERRSDAEFVQGSRHYAVLYQRWRKLDDSEAGNELRERLMQFSRHRGFKAVLLLDAAGTTLWSSESGPAPATPIPPAVLDQARNTQQIRRLGPYPDAAGIPRLDFIIALSGPSAPGYVVLRSDPLNWLQNTLKSWPTPSRTGETLLFRRDGDSILTLNELRHHPGSAVKLRLPLATPLLLAGRVMRGEARPGEILEGVDYRNVPVVGIVRHVPGSDWYLVAKMDREELREGAVRDGIWIGLAGMLALFMAGAGLVMLRQREQLARTEGERRAQAERLNALKLLAAIADASEDAIFALDGDGAFVLFNRAAERLTGRSARQVLGHDEHLLFPPEVAAQRIADNRQVLRSGESMVFEERLPLTQGERVLLTTKGPLRDEKGEIIGLFGIARDITERKQVEDALRESESRFRALVEQSLVGIYIIQDGRFRYVNPGLAAIFGYDSPGEIIDCLPVGTLVSGGDRRQVAENVRRRIDGEIPSIHYGFTGLRKDGHPIQVEVHGLASTYQGRPAVLGVILDVTTGKNAEDALQRQAEELRRRNAELERFNQAMVGRELDMIRLKQEVNTLARELGREPPYPLEFLQDAAPPGEKP